MTAQYDIKTGVPGIRLAIPADEDSIFGLLLMLHEENGFFGLNHNKVIAGIRYATQRQGGIIYVNEGPLVVATLGLVFAQDWYSDDEYLSERWNFVHPAHRSGTNYARKLIEQAKWTSDFLSQGNKRVPLQVSINSLDRTEPKVRLYARHMACIGAYFMYGNPPRHAEKAQAESAKVSEQHRMAKRQPNSRREQRREVARPVVETIIKLSQRPSAA